MKQKEPQFAVIYCRVSDKRQRTEGHGLDSQETRMREYAGHKGYTVVRVFAEDISGKTANRSGLTEMLDFLRRQKEPYLVLIDHASRLTRNSRDYWPLRDKLTSVGAVLESTQRRYSEAPEPEEELHENIESSVNHYYRRANGKQASNRMRARALSGFYSQFAPVGYKFVNVKPQGNILVRDEPVATVLQQALEGYASGYFQTAAEVKRFLQASPALPEKRRKSMTNQRAIKILSRTLYAGRITVPSWGLHYHEGKHEPLISMKTHMQILDRLAGKAHAPARKGLTTDFPLRQFVLCDCCEKPFAGCWSTSRTGKRHAYYLCQTKGCEDYGKSIRRDEMEAQFQEVLAALRPTPELHAMALDMFRDIWDAQMGEAKATAKQVKQELEKTEKLIEQFVQRAVEAESQILVRSYEERIIKLDQDKALLKEKIANCGRAIPDFDETFRTAFTFLENPGILWVSESFEAKRAVLKMAFQERIRYKRNEGFRTALTTSPFSVFSLLKGEKSRWCQERTGVNHSSY